MCFAFLKRNPNKEKTISEPLIPEHRKKTLEVERRNAEINDLKNAHKEKKKENKLIDNANENIADKRLIDIEIDNTTDVALFKVDGIYCVGATILITGFVETGKLLKGMKAIQNENQLKIIEIRKDREAVDYLLPGKEGTIEVKSKKIPLLKQGDYLEFE